jgi:S-formylglutathione hydrolase FrmB
MIRFRRALPLLALIVFSNSLGAAQTTTAPQVAAVQSSQSDHRIQTVRFESKLVGQTLPYNVLLPVDYDSQDGHTRRYPVLYLLHGLTGHYSNWLEKTRLADYARNYELIIVMPEGNDSWYTDSATVARDKYETYLLAEIIPDVERRYRALATRDGRAIAGLSMGGYGALKFGVKHPELFAFAGSLSGALDAASRREADLKDRKSAWGTLVSVFGPENDPTHAANDLNKLFRALPAADISAMPFIYLDCGTEDALLSRSRDLAALLVEKKIPHEYRQLPGGHSWTYWDAQVQEILRVATRKLSLPPPQKLSAAPEGLS